MSTKCKVIEARWLLVIIGWLINGAPARAGGGGGIVVPMYSLNNIYIGGSPKKTLERSIFFKII